MRTIQAFPLREQNQMVPVGAKVLMVALRGDTVTVWMEIEQSAPLELRKFVIVGDNTTLPHEWHHIGSWFSMGYEFDWHVYEIK